MPRSQLKLTAALGALIVLLAAVWGVAAERRLRRTELERVARFLEQRAALVAQQVDPARLAARDLPALDALADRASAAAGARVTLIAPDGAVLGDSEVALARLPAIESHAGRPEVRAALAGDVGRDTRRSATVGRPLFYLAQPLAGGAALRLAVDLSDLDAALAGLRRDLIAAGALALAIGLALSYAFSWLTLRPLAEMRRVAASIAAGRLEDRLPFGGGDELSDLAHAINRMAEQLRLRLDEATHEKEQLRAVLESMVEGVLVLDARGQVLLANSRLREFFGASPDLVGRPLLESIRSAELEEILVAAAESEAPVSRQVSLERPRPRTLRVHAVRFDSGDDARTGTVAVAHDVTELMRLEEVRRDFVANASHELRTPLAAIRGFAETLLANPSLAEADRIAYLEVIERHARRLGNIVHDLLELSTIESRKLRMEPSVIEVGKLAAELIRDAEPRCAERRISLALESVGDPHAYADLRALEHVLGNLLDNAIKYTEPGGHIALRVDGEDPECLRVEVRDSGIGIPKQDLGRIFERFYRVDRARSRALGGTGLGLAIVKHLVQGMGGEIFVTSELGVGSRFAFTLPRAPA